MAYWLSFATSLDPNDGKGSARASFVCKTLGVCAHASTQQARTGLRTPGTIRSADQALLLAPADVYHSKVLLQLNGTNTTTIPDTFRQEQIQFISDFVNSL